MKELPPNVRHYLALQRGSHRPDLFIQSSRDKFNVESQRLREEVFSPEDHQALAEHGQENTDKINQLRIIFEAKKAIKHKANKIASKGVSNNT